MRVALTGGIATGKSYCLRGFAALGAAVQDADDYARRLVEPGTAGLDAVIARFGRSVLRPDAALDRAALGRIVFHDAAARRDLEAILHPRVYAAMTEDFRNDHFGSPVSISDIPLLFESGHQADFGRIVVAACSPAQQIARLTARDLLSEAEAQGRIDAQWPIATKSARADYLIDTSGTTTETDRQIVEVFERLKAEARVSPGQAR